MANPAQEEQRIIETYSGSDKNENPNTKERISSHENSLPDNDTFSDNESDSTESSYILPRDYSIIRSDSSSITDFDYDFDLNENRSEDTNSLTSVSSHSEYLCSINGNVDDFDYYESDHSSIFPTNDNADFYSEDEIEMSSSEDEIHKYNLSVEE